jgi:hypothetical protein
MTMMTDDLSTMDDAFLAREAERTLYAYSSAWEGNDERVLDVGDALVRVQPSRGEVVALRVDAADIDGRLDALIGQVGAHAGRYLWVVGPSTRPRDLADRLVARGFDVAYTWDGLALDDLSVTLPMNDDVRIEPLSWENVEEYAARCTGSTDPEARAARHLSAHRYLCSTNREVRIVVARVGGHVAGYAVLRIEPTRVAYLRSAMTVAEFRRRGVFLSLVAHRLAIARAAGCTAAVVQAMTTTSAPILMKRGFKPVCQLAAFVAKDGRVVNTKA